MCYLIIFCFAVLLNHNTDAHTSLPINFIPAHGATDIEVVPTLNWPHIPGSQLYRIYVDSVADFNRATEIMETTNTYLQLTHLKRQKKYYWRVESFNARGDRVFQSEVLAFTTSTFDINDRADLTHLYNYDGIRDVGTAPPIGEHPRVFFNIEDVPTIRQRLNTTRSGMAANAQIQAYMKLLELGYDGGCKNGKYCRQDDYALDPLGRQRISNPGLFNVKGLYQALISNEQDPLKNTNATKRILLCGIIALRSFDYLIKDNIEGLREVGRAISSLAREMGKYSSDYQCNFHIAMAYDFAANAMNSAQKALVTDKLGKYLATQEPYGSYEESYATTSNWVALTSFIPLVYMAIEGEVEDINPLAYKGAVRAYYNFLSYGFYPSGAGVEGLGKNYMYATTMIAMERRGEKLLGHPYVRSYAERFLPALIQPFGFGFTAYDSLGGSGFYPSPSKRQFFKFDAHDAIGLKWIFPDSKTVDWLWRNYIGHADSTVSKEAEKHYANQYYYGQFQPRGYHNALLLSAIFASDFDTSNSWQNLNIPLTYSAFDRGLVHARSHNGEDALQLQFHVRQDFGGHTNADRLNINLSALGRTWAVYRTEVAGGNDGNPHQMKYHSNVLIDDKGIKVNRKDGTKARQPAILLEVSDNETMMLATGDASYAYKWEYDWSAGDPSLEDVRLNQGWLKVNETLNDFRAIAGAQPHLNIPFYNYASWHGFPKAERMIKKPWLAVDSVIRTVALVRGDEPYALVLDDLKSNDGAIHNYKWQLQIPDDLSILTVSTTTHPQGAIRDIILAEPELSGNRRLLVRVLSAQGLISTPAYITTRTNPRPGRHDQLWPALVLEASTSRNPQFSVMLYPYHEGDDLPETQWLDDKTFVVKYSGLEDTITLFNKHGGRSLGIARR